VSNPVGIKFYVLGFGYCLDGGTDDEVATRCSSYAAGDEEKAFFFADLNHFEVLNGATINAHMTRHLLVLPNETRSKSATNGTRAAMHHGSVCGRLTSEVPALNDALETTAFGHADHVNDLSFGEHVRSKLGSCGRKTFVRLKAELDDLALGAATVLLDVAKHGLAHTLLGDVLIADLSGGVAILPGGRFDLKHLATTNVDDCAGDQTSVIGIDVGHAEFFSDES
jgi:hypothetical protein